MAEGDEQAGTGSPKPETVTAPPSSTADTPPKADASPSAARLGGPSEIVLDINVDANGYGDAIADCTAQSITNAVADDGSQVEWVVFPTEHADTILATRVLVHSYNTKTGTVTVTLTIGG